MQEEKIDPQVIYDEYAEKEIESRRRRAYSDPDTGSDRYFAESSRLLAMGDMEGAEAAKIKGVARALEIKKEYPDGGK